MLTYFLGKEKREDGSTLYFYEKKPGGNVSQITENAVEVGGMKFYKKLKQEK